MSVRDLKPEYFTIEMDGAVCVLRLNRPPANAHNFAMIRELEGIVTEIRYDNDVRAVVLGSANAKFCSTTIQNSVLPISPIEVR